MNWGRKIPSYRLKPMKSDKVPKPLTLSSVSGLNYSNELFRLTLD